MTYPQRVKRGTLIALAALLILTLVGAIMAGGGYATGYMAGFGALGIAACTVILAVTKSKIGKRKRDLTRKRQTHV